LNLLRDFSALGRFDIVLCRNVLIYFDDAAKTDILERIARQMPQDGFLVLGAAESTTGYCPRFRPNVDRQGLFVRADGHGAGPRRPVLVAARP
jgi:chemotaxis protein methyltransferase CheR